MIKENEDNDLQLLRRWAEVEENLKSLQNGESMPKKDTRVENVYIPYKQNFQYSVICHGAPNQQGGLHCKRQLFLYEHARDSYTSFTQRHSCPATKGLLRIVKAVPSEIL